MARKRSPLMAPRGYVRQNKGKKRSKVGNGERERE